MKLINSLKFKITLFVTLGILPPACLSFFFASSFASESLVKKTEEILEIKTTKIKDNVEKLDEINSGVLRSLSSQPDIISMDAKKQNPLLRNIVDNYPQLYRAMTFDTDGYNVARNDSNKRNYRGDRDYFRNAMNGEEIARQALFGRTSKQTSVCMGRAIINSETEIVGVVTICSYLEQISKQIQSLEFGKTGYAIVVDEKGTVLAHPDKSYTAGDRLHNLAEFAPVKNLLENGSDKFSFDHEGETWISRGKRLNNGWGVVVVMSESEFLADERNFEQTMMFIGILSAIALCFGSWILANYLLGPISNLTEAAIAISRGKYDRRVKIDRKDEFGILANSFNQMAKQIGLKQKYLEAEVKKQTQAIALDKKRVVNALNRAEKADRAKEEFLFKLSHELKTPLNAIIGYASQISRTNPNDKAISTILSSGKHLLLMIEDIFNYNKGKKREVVLEKEAVDVIELSNEAIDIIKASAIQKLAIELETSNQKFPKVLADKKRLNQVLINLLNNAVKFTPTGSVKLRVELLKEQLKETTIKFSVIDTGIGISPENLSKIFNDFYQVNQNSGSGLGLSICQQNIKAMGSQIEVQSQVNKGSNFSFVLNLEKTQSDSLSLPYNEIKGYLGRKRKILLVEDCLEIRELLASILEPLGFQVYQANDPKEALNVANQLSDLDLILTDYLMPGQSGFTMLFQLRLNPQYKDIPIIVTSSSDAELIYDISKRHGATDFLPKPVSPEDLLLTLQKYLDLDWTSNTNTNVVSFRQKLIKSKVNNFINS